VLELYYHCSIRSTGRRRRRASTRDTSSLSVQFPCRNWHRFRSSSSGGAESFAGGPPSMGHHVSEMGYWTRRRLRRWQVDSQFLHNPRVLGLVAAKGPPLVVRLPEPSLNFGAGPNPDGRGPAMSCCQSHSHRRASLASRNHVKLA